MSTVERHEFQTEARQLLDLMIHSVYSNKDIFLRELISNASDALDKRRFEALQQPHLLEEGEELHIFLQADKEARTLAIADNGIGMTREEVRELIGTIAKSGTREFFERMKQSRKEGDSLSPELIGQFGVGFYSTFMVADKVTLVTRKAGEELATRWESTGDGTYTLEEAERHGYGTTVTLHLKQVDTDDALHDYAEEWQLRQIVKQYSDFVSYPIRMNVERTEIERDADGKPVEGAEEKTVVTQETLNSMKAIWLRDKGTVTEEEFSEFYKHISHDWNEPMTRIQAKLEGTNEFRMLLFIPSKAPFDLYYHNAQRTGVHLYVKRVFIMDDCKELLPEYLRFVRGVVDSEDLPLNISREILQQNRQLQSMGKNLVKKVLAHLKQMKDQEPAKYAEFWSEFGRVVKEGLFQDRDNQETLLDLVLLDSTMSDTPTALQAYIDRMKPDQTDIYYMTGESRKKLEASPHLEAFRDKGYEVLLLSEPVDEIWTQSVFNYKDKSFTSIGKGTVDLGSAEEKQQDEEARKDKEKEYGTLLEALKAELTEHVKDVRLSNRLTSSAACLVSDRGDMTPQLEQMMRAMGQEVPQSKRILEVNPNHPVLERLHALHESGGNGAILGETAQLLYGQALLAEGGDLPNPAEFSKLVADLMVKALG